MRKVSNVIIITGLIIGFISLGHYLWQSHKIVSPEIVLLKTDEMDNVLKNYVERQGNSSSMVLGKMTKADKVVEYYLFLNNIKMKGFEIKPHTYDGIKIQVYFSDSTNDKSNVIRIKPTDKKLKYIILNDDRFDAESIHEIN